MDLNWSWIFFFSGFVLKDLVITTLLTYFGSPVVNRMPFVFTASIFFQWIGLMYGAHAAPAYVIISVT